MPPACRHVYSCLLAHLGSYQEAVIELKRARLEDPSLLYGYTLTNPQTGKLTTNRELVETVPKQLRSDKSTARTFMQYAHFLARQERWEEASNWVEKAYHYDDELTDGYAYIGNILRAYTRYDDALKYYDKDYSKGRLVPSFFPVYAQLLTLKGFKSKAEQIILYAYQMDSKVKDGYALIGSVYRLAGQYEKSLSYYQKDHALQRLSPAHRHIWGDQLARTGCLQEAEKEITIGYNEEPTLENGFARIGNILRSQGKYTDALYWYERDYREKRLAPFHLLIYAELLAHDERFDLAAKEVTRAYVLDSNLRDGFSCIANILFRKHKFDIAIEWYEKDLRVNRLGPFNHLKLAELLAREGKLEQSLNEVKSINTINLEILDHIEIFKRIVSTVI